MFAPILPRPTIPSCIDRPFPNLFTLFLTLDLPFAPCCLAAVHRRIRSRTSAGTRGPATIWFAAATTVNGTVI